MLKLIGVNVFPKYTQIGNVRRSCKKFFASFPCETVTESIDPECMTYKFTFFFTTPIGINWQLFYFYANECQEIFGPDVEVELKLTETPPIQEFEVQTTMSANEFICSSCPQVNNFEEE